MISRQSFPGNIKFEFTIKLKANSEGVGFLFNIPEKTERKHLSDGYCLWIGSASSKCSKLLRSNVEVVKAQGIFLNSLTNYHVKIEKIDSSIYFYIDKQLQFTYVTQLPLMGTHVGLIIKDDHFEISDIDIWVGSLSLNTSCLAIPDAFLAHQDFPKALSEYKRIAYSFPDRSEGREAQFKAGVTLLEEAKNSLKSQELIEEAIAQFEKLKKTPSAPLYYFGLALAYKELGECDEEIKCYEIAFRRYRSHPLLQLLQEHILFRMQESARKERLLTYQLISFTLARLPKTAIDCSCEKIFHNLNNHLEDLPFIEKDANYLVTNFKKNLHIPLLFWLSKPKALEEYVEIISEDPKNNLRELKNSLFCAIEWKHFGFAAKIFSSLRTHLKNKEIQLIENLFKFHLNKKVYLAKDNFTDIAEIRILLTLSNLAADDNQLDLSNSYLDKVDAAKLSHDWQVQVDSKYIINYLLQEKWDLALSKLEKHAGKYLNRDSSLLFFLYGCYLTAVEGDEIAKVHFNSVLPTTYPRSWSLASHFISGYIDLQNRWFDQAFDYEKKQLYHQLYIFYHAQGERTKSLYFQKLYQEIYLSENYLKGELF